MPDQKGKDEVVPSSPSILRATPTNRAKRLQSRRTYSPYPKESPYPKGSPRTPIRRINEQGSLILSPRSQPTSPQSPSMRALSSIISILSPFGSRQARSSAAFGEPDLEVVEDQDEIQDEQEESVDQETTKGEEDETMEEQESESLYPALPANDIPIPQSVPSTIEESPIIKKPRQSLFTSSSLSAPRHSTPSKTGFAALAASSSQQVISPSAPVFTFGDRKNSANSFAPSLPAYPRLPARSKMTSPLAKNYDLLARFFAEKAEQEAREEETPSAASLQDGEPGGEEGGGLTEIEVAGCMRLIEESLAQGRAGELERLRGDALERASLAPRTPLYMENSRYDHDYMSRSPSLPLGATAGDMASLSGLTARPSSSFLSPSYRSDDARINRSLANTFGSNAAPTKRRHRPLYLGPGQGASAASSLLKRKQQLQQQRNSLANRPKAALYPSAVPSWQREEVDQEDRDASGSNAKRQRVEERESQVKDPAQPARSFSSSNSMPAISFRNPNSVASSSTASVTVEEEPVVVPSRTATADAMLSILSSGPSIPLRRKVPSKGTTTAIDQGPLSAASDIVNPYQTRSRLSKRTSTATGSTSLASKEKERLKEERERKQRLMEESKRSSKESTLEMIERTAPIQAGRRGLRRNKAQEDEQRASEVEAERKRKEDEEKKKRAEAEAEEAKRKQEQEKEAEEKRQAEEEEQKKQKKATDEERQRKTDEVKKRMEKLASQSAAAAAPVSESPATSSSGPSGSRKSIAFGSSFAPKKPSPLSQADNMAPDSPSSSSEASERGAVKPSSFFSSTSNSLNSGDASIVTPAPSSSASFSTPRGAREQALDATASSLPKFDFAVNLFSSDIAPSSNEESRQAAKAKEVAQLPVFDLFSEGDSGYKATSDTSKPSSAPMSFSFASSPAASSGFSSGTSSVNGISSEASPPPTDSESKAADSNVSALLSGTGEGEENESCLHQVRSKVWTLKDGKWADLGIGLFKIKKNDSDGKKRVLVRNEGNGKVMVNFRLVDSFKPILDKNVVSFLGFDGEGKPANYRCKVKTNDNADELAGALRREAVQ